MFGKKPPPLTRKIVLASVPWRNESVEESRDASGALLLTLPRAKTGRDRILSFFVALPRKKTFATDERGEWVWRQCDGTQTVDAIARAGAKLWDVKLDVARQAVFYYTGVLVQRGLLIIQVSEKAERKPPTEKRS